MKRTLFVVLMTAMFAGGTCFAQTVRTPNESNVGARQEMVPAPLATIKYIHHGTRGTLQFSMVSLLRT